MTKKVAILVVDDEPNACKVLARILDLSGYAAETALSGQEALQKARERFFEVVLLDLKLPDADGLELFRSIKAAHSETEVIVTTGNAAQETAVAALREGAFAFLPKPLDMDEVLATIKGLLEDV
jgi:DNA-binding NtrC family response regulator